MTFLKLPTARATILALIGAALVLLRQSGVAVPDGMDETAKIALDVVLGFVALAGSLSAMHRAAPPAKKPAETVKRITMTTAVLVVALALPACGLAKTVNDYRVKLCDLLGEQQRAAIQDVADRQGISLDQAYAAWRLSCLFRVSAAEQEAVGAIGTIGAQKDGGAP